VPDVREEQQRISSLLDRTRRVIHSRVEREEAGLASVRSRPSLASPLSGIDERGVAVAGLRARTHRCLLHRLDRASGETAGALGHIRALSPLATLQRGYAVAQRTDGSVLTSARQVTVGEHISLRLADGSLTVRTVEVRTPADAGGTEEHTEGHTEDPMSDEPARRST
jgi:exodeoxyribonuclease VII large subunit